MASPVAPCLLFDPVVENAAERAFDGLREATPAQALETVVALGFSDALPGPEAREAWPDAAVILRAQARASAPVDMAWLLATGDRDGCIDADRTRRAAAIAALADRPPTAAALALGRCLQISAGMQAALGLSLQYVQDREQFGRPLAKFQAIQHGLAIAAEEVAAATALTDLALAAATQAGCASPRIPILLDAAAVVLGTGVDVVYDACHQVHGAIGFTREYALHRHSLDLLRWRDDLHALRGGVVRGAERLGEAALAEGGVWRAVTSWMQTGERP